MATPPTFVAEYEADWSTTSAGSAKTASVTVANGDKLVIVAATENGTADTISTPTGGGLTYNPEQSIVVSNYCVVYVWTALSSSSQTFTLSLTPAAGGWIWGFNALRFSGSDGIGASNKTNVASGAPSLGLTTTADNSAIVAINADWNATDGTSRTWRTVNSITPTSGNGLEKTYFRNGAVYTVYAAYWSDAGTAGSKTVGLSAPSGQKYAIAAVEVKGVSSTTVNGTASVAGAGSVAANVTQLGTNSPAGAGSVANAVVQQAPSSPTGAGSLAVSVTQRATLSVTGAGALTAPVVQAATASPSGAGASAAAVVQGAVLGSSGAGSVNAAGGVPGGGAASLTGAGTLTVAAVQRAPATVVGAGSLAAAGTQQATAAPAGAGALVASGYITATVDIAGAGVLIATVEQLAAAAPSGTGAVTAIGTGGETDCAVYRPSSGLIVASTSLILRPDSGLVDNPC